MADIFELEGVQEKVKQLELFNETEVEIVDLGKRSKLCKITIITKKQPTT